MAEVMEDPALPEVADESEETVEEDTAAEMPESPATEEATDANISASGNVQTDSTATEPVAELQIEDEKHVDDAPASEETAVVPEDEAAKENVINDDAATAAAADKDGDGVAVEVSEGGNDKTKELEEQSADEPVTEIVSAGFEEVAEAHTEADEAVAKTGADDATTDRVEHVTSKAEKATVSVEMPAADEVSEEVVVSGADIENSSAVTKSEKTDTDVSVNKTAQDVTKMAGNDELKFGVLIGLVHVGQFSNKDVVDSVLCLVSIH